jgi:toluene monooxygenase system ferredoxin subunit
VTFRVAAMLDDVWCGEMCGVIVDGCRVLLVGVGADVRAFEDRCAHQAVRLSEGRLEGSEIVCRAHAWRYDADTGWGTNPRNVQLRSFPVRIDDGCILVDVAAGAEGDP